MDNLIFSLNSVVPLFAAILMGIVLRRLGIINANFIDVGTKIGFRVALPFLLFSQVAGADLSSGVNPNLFWFAIVSVCVTVALCCLITPMLVKDRAKCGAIAQALFRGNFAILGIPLAINMFGQEGAMPTTLLLPITVPLYNILAVVVLVLFEPHEGERTKPNLKKILIGVVTNPLIISIVLALPIALLRWEMPVLLTKSVDMIGSLATPIALLCLGGQFDWKNARSNLRYTLPATLMKQAVIPAIMLAIAIWLGFRDGDLGAVFILFMAPCSVSSYIMAQNMHSDGQLAAQMIMWTTLTSMGTMCLGIFLLRTFGCI